MTVLFSFVRILGSFEFRIATCVREARLPRITKPFRKKRISTALYADPENCEIQYFKGRYLPVAYFTYQVLKGKVKGVTALV